MASPSKKRKADGDTGSVPGTPTPSGGAAASSGAQQPKPKKRKPVAPGTPIKSEPDAQQPSAAAAAAASARPQISPGTELSTAQLVSWLRMSPGATTRECIHYFQPALTDDAKKAKFTALVKEVASLKGGVLALKAHYRDSYNVNGNGKAAIAA